MCVSGYVCMSASLTTMPVNVTDIKCLAYFEAMYQLLSKCVFICGTFVAFLSHNAYFVYFVCLPGYYLHVAFTRMGPNIQDWGDQM